MFVTKEDSDKPPLVSELLDQDDYGVVLPDGSINWDCPCLGKSRVILETISSICDCL